MLKEVYRGTNHVSNAYPEETVVTIDDETKVVHILKTLRKSNGGTVYDQQSLRISPDDLIKISSEVEKIIYPRKK